MARKLVYRATTYKRRDVSRYHLWPINEDGFVLEQAEPTFWARLARRLDGLWVGYYWRVVCQRCGASVDSHLLGFTGDNPCPKAPDTPRPPRSDPYSSLKLAYDDDE